ncbi:lipopolysaccharide assembly protein LapA domain-containing protein [Psittacicella gerlachiana]|uniref:Lipopolysaccharide assembly protein A domain-containing protein n=1 Tax=Psittacicella gerlachiana TaxID=2028574 RepID=A0A3A1YDK3_9GAMM|nr:LapA family protein [Psittacicella gerlachiana]RIY35466.1 hypothetical protein CKF59_03650 [Psittacicella gerlachiana]
MKLIRYLCYLLFLIALITVIFIFTSANDQLVHVNFLFGEFDGRLSFILGMAFIFGFVIALVVLFLLYAVLKTKLVVARSRVQTLEKKVQKLEVALETLQLDAKEPKTTSLTATTKES